jgi:hypothetical protein
MFPGPYAEVIRNEAGEPVGWDNHYYDEEPYDPDEFFGEDDDE